MRYMMFYRPGSDADAPPSQEDMDKVGALMGEMIAAGKLLYTEGLRSSARGARVRIDGGDFAVTDGPFPEAKEVVGGFAIMQARDLDEAKELSKRFLAVMGTGSTEIREMEQFAAYASPEAFPMPAGAQG